MSVLEGQIALVTGSSGGIGGAVAAALAGLGMRVVAVGRTRSKLEAFLDQHRHLGAALDGRSADLTNDDDIGRLVEHVAAAYGRLDVLVHSAGAIAHGRLEDAPIAVMDQMYAANVRGPYRLTQLVLPLLKRPRGQVVFVNSTTGLAARPNAGQLSITQHAFRALADGFRHELNADEVRVLSVFLGRTATPRIEALMAEEGLEYRPELLMQPEDVASVVCHALALSWTAEVMDIRMRPMRKSDD